MTEAKKYPIIKEIKAGWAAMGDGWTVHAPTREEVVEKYEERKKFYEWLDAQPLKREQGSDQLVAAD